MKKLYRVGSRKPFLIKSIIGCGIRSWKGLRFIVRQRLVSITMLGAILKDALSLKCTVKTPGIIIYTEAMTSTQRRLSVMGL